MTKNDPRAAAKSLDNVAYALVRLERRIRMLERVTAEHMQTMKYNFHPLPPSGHPDSINEKSPGRPSGNGRAAF